MSAFLAICLAGMVGPGALAEDWTWDGDEGNWTDENWTRSGGTGGYPNSAGDNVTISGSGSTVTFDATVLIIGSLTLTNTAHLKVPLVSSVPHTLKIQDENGLTLEDSGTQLILEGGVVELLGGGDVSIEGDNDCVVLFQTIDDGQLRFSGAKAYAIVREAALAGTSFNNAIRADGVHGIIDGGSAAGDDEVVMLFENTIRGDITITAQLINAGLVIIDEADKNTTLCFRPKMGSGTWQVDNDDASIIVDAIVVGDSCSRLNVQKGKADVNTFWLSAGKIWMQGNPPVEVGVAAGKIMQFGRRHYCGCSSE